MSMDDLNVLQRPRSGGGFFLSFFVAAITSAGVFFGLREWVPPKDAASKPAAGPEVPELVGMLVADARAALDQRGLLLVLEAEREDHRMSAGKINSQVPLPGSRLRAGGEVRATVSTAPPKVEVPDVAGLAVDKSIEKLVAAKLAAKAGAEVPEPSPDVAAGMVIGTDPAAGTAVAPGTEVKLRVSSGPPAPAGKAGKQR
jgi:serine/threonine-protein kinase